MTELQLYKYINDNNIEWHRRNNDGTPIDNIFIGEDSLGGNEQ